MGFLSRILQQLNCLKCDRMLNHPFVICSKCNELQRIPTLNYFQLFNIQSPSTMPTDLKQRYIKLQSMAHPDRHNSNESAQNMSSFISNAFNIINNPFKKAEYALKLQKVAISDYDKVQQCFLMQVMELQEEDDNDDKIRRMMEEFKTEFWNHYDDKDYEKAKDVLLKWKFLNKI